MESAMERAMESVGKSERLYDLLLGIREPWKAIDIRVSVSERVVEVVVGHQGGRLDCPRCGKACPRYDGRERRWRHVDTCDFRTFLTARVPRVRCPEHGVAVIGVPWAERGGRFTALFEAKAIGWMRGASVSEVARQLRLGWNAADGIMGRAVKRGLARRGEVAPRRICVDECSSRKGHVYVTVVTDRDRGNVLHVAYGRDAGALGEFYGTLTEERKAAIESVSMDMWAPCIKVTRDAIPNADSKIAYDRFHIAQALGKAVDAVRRKEHRELTRQGDDRLKGSRYLWLRHPRDLRRRQRQEFSTLRHSSPRAARAWAIKEFAAGLWKYRSHAWARKGWPRPVNWMARSRLEPMRKLSRTPRGHLDGILTAVPARADNGLAESMNSRIKVIKSRARGFRNKERFRNAIYFHCGGLQLYPEGVGTGDGLPTHTN